MAKACNNAHYRLNQYFTMAIMLHYILQILEACVKLEQNNYEYNIAIAKLCLRVFIQRTHETVKY